MNKSFISLDGVQAKQRIKCALVLESEVDE